MLTRKNRLAPRPPIVCGAALIASLALAGAVHASGAPALSERDIPDDLAVTHAVSDQLVLDPGVDAHAIDVVTRDGVTTLTGRVDSILAKDRAAAVARTVKGVRAVVDRVVVEAPDVADAQLERDVRDALLANPRTESYEVVVAATNGAVRLTGTVDSWRELDLVDKVVRGVRGVTAVTNDLLVASPTARTAADIREDVRGGLRWDRYVDDSLIEVRVEDGVVRLSGTVGSAAERVRAMANAWVMGVSDVQADELKVEFWARRDDLRERKYAHRDDAAIRAAIESALVQDPRVLSEHVGVTVRDGVATLRGTVDTLDARAAAAANARNTVGVAWVRDRLKVRPAVIPNDPLIVQRIERRWALDPYVESFELLSARSDNGKVRIEGAVNTSFERLRAERLAWAVPGVVEVSNAAGVVNDLQLPYNPYLGEPFPYDFVWYNPTTTSYRPDREIAREVREELWWSPFVDSDSVNVSADDGVVTLTGTVDTWGERQAATENALEGGAVKVINKLSVRYGS